MTKLLINLTTAQDSPDRTTVAFVIANAGIAAGQEVTVFLNIEAVRLATPGYADAITSPGFKPLKELMETFVANGGQVWICPPCYNARGLDPNNIIAGASFAGSPAVVALLAEGAASLSY